MEKNNNGLISGILIIVSFLIGLFANDLFNKTSYTPPSQEESAIEISSEIQKALSVNGKAPSVVFSLTPNGSMQAFVPEGSKLITPTFPLHADNLLNIDTITIYTTSNPKFCWKTGNGNQQCVTW